MRRLWRRLVIVIAVLGSAHAYIWWRFVAAPDLPSPWFQIASIGLALVAPSLPASILVSRRWSRAQAAPFLWFVYTWFGFAVYLLLAAALAHLAVAIAGISARSAALGGIAAAILTIVYGLLHVRFTLAVRRVRVPLARLPAEARGYRIVQLTDVHIGWTLGSRFAARVAAAVNALEPDVVVLTGDIAARRAAREGWRLRRHRQPRVLLERRRVDRPSRYARLPVLAQRARRAARLARARRRR
jgi:hypothetical protein